MPAGAGRYGRDAARVACAQDESTDPGGPDTSHGQGTHSGQREFNERGRRHKHVERDEQGTKEAGAMSLAQLHYTSAPPGPDGSGFRFTAVTPGLPPSLLTEAERLLGYEAPSDASRSPSPAELASFPQVFSHSVLSDGSRLLARTVPTGAGHADGPDNFHAHVVVLPPGTGLPGGALPITAWNSARWVAETPQGGVPAQLEGLPASGHLGRDALIGFAASRASLLADFFAGLRQLGGEAPARQMVLIERDSADVARWIALASTALPHPSADRLTFTTYTRQPRLAGQQIIGVLPEDARAHGLTGHDHRYRVHDCVNPGPAQPSSDAWAEIAARVWLGRAPELFAEAAALPGEPCSAGALAFVALRAEVTVGSQGRTEAALWAREHARALDEDQLSRLVEALCAPADDRTSAESAALTGLFTALSGWAPEAATTALGALALTTAARIPNPGLDLTELRELPAAQLTSLADILAPELREGITQDTGQDYWQDVLRPVELLRVAVALNVDCADLLPGLADRLARALLAAPEAAYTPAVATVLEEHFELRTALLSRLDALAVADPLAAVRLLSATPLASTGVQVLPQLRMCAGAPWLPAEDGGDRGTALRSALRACGVSPFNDPLVLRTAVRLVWQDSVPTAGEALRMLGETGSDAHRVAGTWRVLVQAALEGASDDDAPQLAHDLLRCFPDELSPRVRGALLLLEFTKDLGSGSAAPPWTSRALTLRADAEPVEPALLVQVFTTLAHRLLSEDRPDGELYALIHSGDPDLLAAYTGAAQEDRVRDRLRTSPAYAADCFIAWSSLPGANRAWDGVRTTLLDKVLRPAVRALPEGDVASVEQTLQRAGAHRAEEFRTWNRPGALSRLGRRFGALGRSR
ncbi:GTPase-associated protein 1-related protein [Streptomyces sp. NPDC088725]|uniref:GTPase-associated protein 1-related protein n=1 Tax=Streptomyces sp. NPDC088725 TaxID=3365873 RepID=UPI00382BD28D